MSDHPIEHPKKSSRRQRGLLLTLAILLVLLLTYRLVQGPTLRPVTRRMLPPGYAMQFSLENCGYPALQSVSDPGMLSAHNSYNLSGVLLDDRCVPIAGKRIPFWSARFSPRRQLILSESNFFWTSEGHHALLRTGDTVRECPLDTHTWSPWTLTDRAVIYAVPPRDNTAPDIRLTPVAPPRAAVAPPRAADGALLPPGDHYRWIELPKCEPGYAWSALPCADTRYLALWRRSLGYVVRGGRPMPLPGRATATGRPEPNFAIYDMTTKRLVLRAPFGPASPAPVILRRSMAIAWDNRPRIVFHHHGRFLAIPVLGQATLYEAGHPARTFGTASTVWSYGEDGTVWVPSGSGVELLRWRQQKPALVKQAMQLRLDSRFNDVWRSMYDRSTGAFPLLVPGLDTWATAWHDGELTARTETVKLMPEGMARAYDLGRHLLGQQKLAPREGRRLTLYRHGKRLGVFTVRLKYAGSRSMPYHEHLAFTHDGRYLSWVIDAGNGLQVYAFKVPKSAWQVW